MYLLDTHTFLWFIWNDPQLSARAKDLIQNTLDCYVSMCSLWEISIKASLNKLTLPAPYPEYVPQQLNMNAFKVLPIKFKHLAKQNSLPWHHKDPFDRLLISQAMEEGLTLVTRDPKFAPYNIICTW